MKSIKYYLIILIVMSFITPQVAHAQILRGLGEKVEGKLKKKAEEKIDRHIDKTINTADKKSDESIENAVKGKKPKKSSNKTVIPGSGNKNSSSASLPDIPIRKDISLRISDASNCADFLWFKKNSQLHYEQKSDQGTEQSRLYVKNVKQQQGKSISEISISQKINGEDFEFDLNYICDGDNFYLDMKAMFEQLKKQMQTLGIELETDDTQGIFDSAHIDLSEGFTHIPKYLYQGMTLPDAFFEFTTAAAGMEMIIRNKVTNRVVEAKEQVNTPAGSFEAMKIRSVNNVEMEFYGRVINSTSSVDYVWFAPKLGMIKQETYTDNKLDFSNILIKINP